MPVEVKICGLRRAADAAVAIEGGATYLGVVYAGGPRKVSDSEAQEVVKAAGDRPVLAVWGEPDRDQILRSRDATGFRGVQLHGGGDAALARSLRNDGLLVWRVLKVGDLGDLAQLEQSKEGADGLLIEPRVPGKAGGAGVPLDLDLARAAGEKFGTPRSALRTPRFVLAGGLRPDTVREAIAAAAPDIVDVSSGVESAPGVKDPHLIRKFLELARADHPSP